MVESLQETEALFPALPAPKRTLKIISRSTEMCKGIFCTNLKLSHKPKVPFQAHVHVLIVVHTKVGQRTGNKYGTWFRSGKPGPLQLFKQYFFGN